MPVQFTTALPAPSSASTTVVADGENISLSWTRNDSTSVGGHDIERSDDGGGSWSTVASGLSATTTSYTDSTVANGSTYEYRVQRYTDDTSSYSNETSPLRVPLRLTRAATVSGDAAVTASRGGLDKTRSAAMSGDTDIALHTRAEFNEVFPDEQTESLSWDFSFSDPFGFVSEWFDETADLPIEADAFTVVVDSRIVQTYELGVEYDVDGDGNTEYRTDTKTVERDGQTLTFPNLGEPGQYRLYIQQMRLGDYLRAVTVGPTRY